MSRHCYGLFKYLNTSYYTRALDETLLLNWRVQDYPFNDLHTRRPITAPQKHLQGNSISQLHKCEDGRCRDVFPCRRLLETDIGLDNPYHKICTQKHLEFRAKLDPHYDPSCKGQLFVLYDPYLSLSLGSESMYYSTEFVKSNRKRSTRVYKIVACFRYI